MRLGSSDGLCCVGYHLIIFAFIPGVQDGKCVRNKLDLKGTPGEASVSARRF